MDRLQRFRDEGVRVAFCRDCFWMEILREGRVITLEHRMDRAHVVHLQRVHRIARGRPRDGPCRGRIKAGRIVTRLRNVASEQVAEGVGVPFTCVR